MNVVYENHINGQTLTVIKYYTITGQYYLLMDHLGSVVAVLNSGSDLESDEQCLRFGGLRNSTDISHAEFAFTGQRNLSGVGLIDYNPRRYFPTVGWCNFAYD
jgi:hypothetical protein